MVKSLQEILNKRISQTFYKLTDAHFMTNVVGKSITSISIRNIVNQLSRHDFSCGQMFLVGLKGMNLFPIK